jgi:uncharacterized protein (TIGR00251 family)
MDSEPDQPVVELQDDPRGVILPVRAAAGSRRNAILGIRNGAVRVAVTAAPEKGKANKAIIAVLSKAFDVSKSSIELVSGETSQQKRFLIVGSNVNTLRQSITELIAESQS